MPLYYKEKTPSKLNALLLAFAYFKEHWKLIPPTIRLLHKINHWNLKNEGASEITRTRFKDLYGNDYPFVLSILETAGLIQVNRICRKGHCYKFTILPKAQTLLADDTWEYLYQILKDPTEKRKLQKRQSERNRRNPVSETIRMISEINKLAEYDLDQVKAVADRYPEGKRASVGDLLVQMRECTPADLKHNVKDNRLWHPYLQLPAEIKALIKIKDLSYIISADLRSCHPSCWAEYVFNLNPSKDLQEEREKYNGIFLDKSVDPKSYVANRLGISREKVKEIMIKFFNGYKVSDNPKNPFFKFNEFLKNEFPLLYSEWQKTDIKQTGNNIAKQFETKLVQDGSIFEFAKSLGYMLGYEYDGFSVYGKDKSRLNDLYSFIEKRSVELLGFQLILCDKDNRETLAQIMAKSKINLMCEEVERNSKKMESIRKFNFGAGNHSRWQEFYNLRDRNNFLLRKIQPIADESLLFIN